MWGCEGVVTGELFSLFLQEYWTVCDGLLAFFYHFENVSSPKHHYVSPQKTRPTALNMPHFLEMSCGKALRQEKGSKIQEIQNKIK